MGFLKNIFTSRKKKLEREIAEYCEKQITKTITLPAPKAKIELKLDDKTKEFFEKLNKVNGKLLDAHGVPETKFGNSSNKPVSHADVIKWARGATVVMPPNVNFRHDWQPKIKQNDHKDDMVIAMGMAAMHLQEQEIMEETLEKQEFKYEVLTKMPNQKYAIERAGYNWKEVREAVIKAYNNQCQVTGRYIERWMGVYFYDLEGWLKFTKNMHGNHCAWSVVNAKPEKIKEYAVCLCEAAMHGMTGLALYKKGDWIKDYIDFVWTDVWEPKQYLMASISRQVNQTYFQKYVYKIGYYEYGREDYERNLKDGLEGVRDVDLIRDYYPETIVEILSGQTDEFDNDVFCVYNQDDDIKVITKEQLLNGLRVNYTKKYEVITRNKESKSLKIKYGRK